MKIQPLAGYPGTPLAKKLGIREGSHLLVLGAPANYVGLLQPVPNAVIFDQNLSQATDGIHVFTKQRDALKEQLTDLRHRVRSDATVWVSWPKKSSKVTTDINEDAIREVALPLGLVDVKVCAVSDVWSGLKLVIRKELR
ncbi:MAG: DUF3052 family protein [Dehalococcoidia bacterium]|nr:DUF3052 family protein [Dehalococcoidia bacterium]